MGVAPHKAVAWHEGVTFNFVMAYCDLSENGALNSILPSLRRFAYKWKCKVELTVIQLPSAEDLYVVEPISLDKSISLVAIYTNYIECLGDALAGKFDGIFLSSFTPAQLMYKKAALAIHKILKPNGVLSLQYTSLDAEISLAAQAHITSEPINAKTLKVLESVHGKAAVPQYIANIKHAIAYEYDKIIPTEKKFDFGILTADPKPLLARFSKMMTSVDVDEGERDQFIFRPDAVDANGPLHSTVLPSDALGRTCMTEAELRVRSANAEKITSLDESSA